MQRRDFIISVPLLVCSKQALSDDRSPFTGVWEVEVPFKGVQTEPKYIMMKQVGSTLRVKDLATGREFNGLVNHPGIKFDLALGGAIASSNSYSFEGKIMAGALTGHTELAGQKYPWAASRLTSAYSCSNHQPSHVAKSKEDMEKFSKEKKCEGWQRARPETITLK